MDRLDYELIAKSFSRSREEMDCDPAYLDAIDSVAEALAFDIWVQNPRFNRQSFLEHIGCTTCNILKDR